MGAPSGGKLHRGHTAVMLGGSAGPTLGKLHGDLTAVMVGGSAGPALGKLHRGLAAVMVGGGVKGPLAFIWCWLVLGRIICMPPPSQKACHPPSGVFHLSEGSTATAGNSAAAEYVR